MRRLQNAQNAQNGHLSCLDITGAEPLEVALRERAVDLPFVRFLGWQTPHQLDLIMLVVQAVVVPSRIATDSDCEYLLTVVLESIWAGLPVVASNHAGIPEIIRDQETRFLVPENDPASLAVALLVLVQPRDHVQYMVANAQA